jgi:bifunctional DNase/RNase
MDVHDVIRVREGADQGWPAAHVVILAETDGHRRLPIWIGEAEAISPALALEKVEVLRPGPHALTAQVVAAVGGWVREVTPGVSLLPRAGNSCPIDCPKGP